MRTAHTAPRQALEVCDFHRFRICEGGGESLCQRMFRAVFERQEDTALFGRESGERLRERGASLRDSAGFVEHNGVDVLRRLQTLRIFDEYAFLRCASDTHHECRGRGKSQRTRAGDDQHGDGGEQSPREVAAGLVAEEEPKETREHRQRDDGGHEDSRHFVHYVLNRSF